MRLRADSLVFVDTGAWVALAVVRDPLHERARAVWSDITRSGARLASSIPVVIETFTFLARNTSLETALRWKDSVYALKRIRLIDCSGKDLRESWVWFERRDLHKLSSVDATSFALMTRHKIRAVFAFDHHFAQAGFTML